jgi:TPR repeat protein
MNSRREKTGGHAALIVLALAAACALQSCTPFWGIGPQGKPCPEGASQAVCAGMDKPIPGEPEFLKGDYAAAYPLMAPLWGEGNLRAVFYMRIMLQYGLHGPPPNPGSAEQAVRFLALHYSDLKALTWPAALQQKPLYYTAMAHVNYLGLGPGGARNLSAAAEQASFGRSAGFTPAHNMLAALACGPEEVRYFTIRTLTKADCFSASLEAAEASDILAMGNVSALYREGTGTGRDPLQAVNWAHLAATRTPPLARAQNDMGYYYETGSSVTKDLPEAKKYYSAAQARCPLAKANLDRLARGGKGEPSLSSAIDF